MYKRQPRYVCLTICPSLTLWVHEVVSMSVEQSHSGRNTVVNYSILHSLAPLALSRATTSLVVNVRPSVQQHLHNGELPLPSSPE